MRVAVVTESFLPSVNGVSGSVCRVLEHLSDRGHEAVVVAPGPAPSRFAGFPVREVTAVPWRQFSFGLPSPHVRQVLMDFSPDVVHVASPFVLGASGLVTARELRLPTVAVFQTDVAGFARRHRLTLASNAAWRWIRRIHSLADVTLAPSTASVDDLRRHGVPRVALWRRGVDLQRFHPGRRDEDLRNRLAPQGQVLVGYVGRLAPEKRVERLAALGGLPGVRVVVVGDGPSRGSVARALEPQGAVLLGHLDGEELGRVYASLDVFAHTGTEETFGQTIQEAMAARVPVVAPAAGGPLDLVDHGVTGLLYPPEDDGALRAAVGLLAADPGVRARAGEAGRRAVLGRTWDVVGDQLLVHYARAAERAATRSRAA